MRVLYLTDDRSGYGQGLYYTDWIREFRRNHDVLLWGEGFPAPREEEILNAELLVVGHGAIDLFARSYVYRCEAEQKRLWRGASRGRAREWRPADFSRLRCPKICLSKNDYKSIPMKVELVRGMGVDLLVTHSRNAVKEFASRGVAAEWIPFGVNRTLFRDAGGVRDIDVGFRGNLNSEWNGGIRERFVDELGRQCSDLNLDIVTSTDGESFLHGGVYVAWLNRCRLVLNTVSAIGTVGTKWFEEMACGCVPVAPVDEYEGLLQPDVHYLAVEPDFSDLRRKIDAFATDDALRNRILAGISRMTDAADMRARFAELWLVVEDKLLRPEEARR